MSGKDHPGVPNWLARWGALVGLVGGIVGFAGGGISLYEKFFPPSVEVLGMVPVAVRSKENMPMGGGAHWAEGISLVMRLRSGWRPVSVDGIDAKGRIYLSSNEYMMFLSKAVEGRSLDDIQREANERKPFYRVSWTGWPEDGRVSVRLEPHQERYIRFTFLEPSLFVGVGFEGGPEQYVGFEDAGIVPQLEMTRPNLVHIFKQRVTPDGHRVYSYDVRDEIKNGLVVFELRVGSRGVRISPSQIERFKSFSREEWEKFPTAKLFHQEY